MKREHLEKWIKLYKMQLVGSAIFTQNNGSLISRLISKVTQEDCTDSFVPSHVGSLVLIGGNVYIFDMKPPKAKLTRLEDYILKTKDIFVIVMRNFELNTEEFSVNVCERVNQNYGYLSAIQSAFKWLWYPLREHCSEIHLKELQKQGLFPGHDPNETTPEDMYHILLGGRK